jgi:protein involved in polysaccharide export with SLBB domain
MEAVSRPGYYSIPEKGQLTILDALGLAGGPSAKTKEVALVRRTATGVQTQTISMQKIRSGHSSEHTVAWRRCIVRGAG